MYLLDFVNNVRAAQSCETLGELPPDSPDGGSSPLELAMGCRLESGLMRLSSPQAAAAVADATGLPVGVDRMTIALPQALSPIADELHASGISQATRSSTPQLAERHRFSERMRPGPDPRPSCVLPLAARPAERRRRRGAAALADPAARGRADRRQGRRRPAPDGTRHPARIVAFAREGGWKQVPVQVDERALVDYGAVRRSTEHQAVQRESPTPTPGPSPEPTPIRRFDADDELARWRRTRRAGGQEGEASRRESAAAPAPRSASTTRCSAGTSALPLSLPARRELDPTAGQALRRLRLQAELRRLQDDLRLHGVADNGNGPPANTGGLDRDDALLLPAPALALDRGPSFRSRREATRRRHPRRRQGPGLLRAAAARSSRSAAAAAGSSPT